jgi:hypothetical protein
MGGLRAVRGDRRAQAVATLVELCGHLPLAIALLAGRLAHHPHWNLAEFARFVRNRSTAERPCSLGPASGNRTSRTGRSDESVRKSPV